jgi:crossover junction endodeoxyribonuclease RuvC
MRVLGIDPAAAGPTGYGVVESDGRSCRMVEYGVLPAARHARPAELLREIHKAVGELIEKFRPDAVAVEAPFAALNIRTALRLAEVRGVVLLAGDQRGREVFSYSPREVKLVVAGHGNADKQQVQQMVRAQLCLAELPAPFDAADALAVALCHIHTARARARLAAATRQPAPAEAGRAPRSRFRRPRILRAR